MVSLRYPGWSPGRTCNFAEFQLQFPQTLYIYVCVSVYYSVFVNGNWLSPEPAFRYFYLAAWLPQSELHMLMFGPFLQGRERSVGPRWHRWIQLCGHKIFNRWQLSPSCQLCCCCFWHVRCSPTSTYKKQLQASVCVCVSMGAGILWQGRIQKSAGSMLSPSPLCLF